MLTTASAGDFVFFDSPYAPLKLESFESYTKEGFSLENHERLARLFKELTDKGVYCMLTNHNTELISQSPDSKESRLAVRLHGPNVITCVMLPY